MGVMVEVLVEGRLVVDVVGGYEEEVVVEER